MRRLEAVCSLRVVLFLRVGLAFRAELFRAARSGSFLPPVSRFHSSNVSFEIFPSTRSCANFRLCAWLLNGIRSTYSLLTVSLSRTRGESIIRVSAHHGRSGTSTGLKVTSGADQEEARGVSVLIRSLAATGMNLSWQLFYNPSETTGSYCLNIHAVLREPSTILEGPRRREYARWCGLLSIRIDGLNRSVRSRVRTTASRPPAPDAVHCFVS